MLLWSCCWLVRDFHDEWLITVLKARRPWDQCAADCTMGSLYYCLHGGEIRPLGRPVFPVYWLHCSHQFVWIAEGYSDKPSSRRGTKLQSTVSPNISFHSHIAKECGKYPIDWSTFQSAYYLFDIYEMSVNTRITACYCNISMN